MCLPLSLQWQCYIPTLALLISHDFGLPITAVGWLFLTFVGVSIISSCLLRAHLKYWSPFTLLWTGFTLRLLSGLLHALGCLCISTSTTAFQLLFASRVVHGYTFLLFPLSVAWIDARDLADQRTSTLATRNAYTTLGSFLGILSGSSLAAIIPDSLMAGAAPGCLNMLVSLLMLIWLNTSFADRALLPIPSLSTPPARPQHAQQPQQSHQEQQSYQQQPTAAAHVPEHWLLIHLSCFAQFFGWIGLSAIEGSLSLIVVESFGFTHSQLFAVWVPTSAFMLLGSPLFIRMHRWRWRASSVATVAIAALPFGVVGLVWGMGPNLSARVPPVFSRTTSGAPWAPIAAFSCGLGTLCFAFAVSNILFNWLLMSRAPRFQAPVQTLAAVARGIGPYLGVLIITKGDETEPGLGPRLMLAAAYIAIALSILVPSAFGGKLYDSPSLAPML